MTAEQQRDLPEMMEDRDGQGSTVVTSHLPVEHWHELIGNPTIADAILDRFVTTPTAYLQEREPAQSRH
ncbi:DNA replication protein DnaC [Bradyrhizobium sp. IAR9]|nr:DNA replication protein DnaC [Bradyrhizobium sp. IAR9]